MTRFNPLAALLTSAALLLTPTLGVTPAHADETKPDRKPGSSITSLSGDLGQVTKAREQLGRQKGSHGAAGSYPDSLTVYTQNYTRSPDSACEDFLAQVNVATDLDSETGTGEWTDAIIQWRVATPYGLNEDYGTITTDGSYEFSSLFWCSNLDGYGTFTLEVEATYFDSSGTAVGYDNEAQAFSVSRPPVEAVASSKVTFSKGKYRAHGSKMNVRVTRANRAWANRPVVMQANFCGGWQEMLTKRASSGGRVTFTVNPEAGWNTEKFCGRAGARIPFRFSVSADSKTRGDVSPSFRVVRR